MLPWLMAGASAVIILTVLLIPQQPGEGFGPELGPILGVLPLVIGVTYAFVAGLILRRHPRHAVGWLLALFAASFSVGVLFEEYAHTSGLPSREWVVTFSGIGWMLGVLPLVCLTPLLFPTGTVLSPGWRWFGGAAAGGLLVVVVANLVDPAHNDELGLVNPLGVPAMAPWIDPLAHAGMTLVVIGAIGGLASIVRRYRWSVGVERTQVRWFGYGAAVTFLSAMVLGVLYEVGRLEAGLVVFAVGVLALPGSIGVAILRYRLYDIDRIVSQTVSYAVVTPVLAGIGAGSEVVVAASTLAVAAALRPVRTRVQAADDRRFGRTRDDAARIVHDHGQRLSDQVELSTFVTDLGSTASETVAATNVSGWINPVTEPS